MLANRGLIRQVVFGKKLINMGNIGNRTFNHGRMSQVVSRRVKNRDHCTSLSADIH